MPYCWILLSDLELRFVLSSTFRQTLCLQFPIIDISHLYSDCVMFYKSYPKPPCPTTLHTTTQPQPPRKHAMPRRNTSAI
jgi:hypothetical protein